MSTSNMGERLHLAHRRIVATLTFVACATIVASATCARAADLTSATAPNFTLFDQHGKPFTLSKERGWAVVLFFGYAHCPDVCPTILANLVRAKAGLGSAS
jgi:cytochrome oxidase Cu insertion factor (SCO1/SenC/PrrC family)